MKDLATPISRNLIEIGQIFGTVQEKLFLNSSINYSPIDLIYLNRIKSIRQILPWFIITFGLIGNIFILLIFLRMRNKKRFNSNGFCFCALAISDSIALIFMLLRSFLKINVLNNIALSCKLIKFIYYSSLQISSWCLVLLTIDRLIAVIFIFKYKQWSKKFYVPLILLISIFLIMLINLHLLIFVTSDVKKPDIYDFTTTRAMILNSRTTTTVTKFKTTYICGVDPVEYPFYSKYIFANWDTYHAVIYGALPFFIILGSNIMIILKLTFLKNMNIKKTQIKVNGSNKSLDKVGKSFKSTQITIMLLSIAFLFLIFTSPISLYMTIFYKNLKNMRDSKREYIKVVLRYIAYFNNAINFYVYVSFSKEFRKEFVDLIRCCYRFKPLSSTVTICTTSTSLPSLNEEAKPLPPRTKPIIRQGLKINSKRKYEINNRDSSGINQPFIRRTPSQDALEEFKQNTKNAKLIYYKKENQDQFRFLNNSNKKDSKTFINSNSTYV